MHTFGKDERIVVEGDALGGGGFTDFLSDMAGYGAADESDCEEEADYPEAAGGENNRDKSPGSDSSKSSKSSKRKSIMRSVSKRRSKSSQRIPGTGNPSKSRTIAAPEMRDATTPPTGHVSQSSSSSDLQNSATFADSSEPGGQAVIFKPTAPIKTPTSDVNVAIERRNRAPGTMGLTMVTAVAHVWFNTFFEGNGPEQEGKRTAAASLILNGTGWMG